MKKTVVLFEKGKKGGRVFVNPENVKELSERGDILINPIIPRGVKPENWVYTPRGIKHRGGVEGLRPIVIDEKPVIHWNRYDTYALLLAGSIALFNHDKIKLCIYTLGNYAKLLYGKLIVLLQ